MVGQTLMDPAFPVAPFWQGRDRKRKLLRRRVKTVPRFEKVGARAGCEWPVREHATEARRDCHESKGIVAPVGRRKLRTTRQVEVPTGQGMPRLDAIRQIGVTEQTYYRWKKKYGGMGTDQLKELKRLQNWSRSSKRSGGSFVRRNNERLRKAVSDLTLDKLILAEAAKGNF